MINTIFDPLASLWQNGIGKNNLAFTGAVGTLSKMRKTKIICTLGPASEKPEVLRELMIQGADVFRLNMSHATA